MSQDGHDRIPRPLWRPCPGGVQNVLTTKTSLTFKAFLTAVCYIIWMS